MAVEVVQPVAVVAPQAVTIGRQRTINISKTANNIISKSVITNKDLQHPIIPIIQTRVRVLKVRKGLKKNFKNFEASLIKCLHFYNLAHSNSIHLLCYKTAKYIPFMISSKILFLFIY